MSQTTEVQASPTTREILCTYRNETGKIQVARIANISGWYFEKVVFPSQQILFMALPEAEMEVYTGATSGVTLFDKFPCTDLGVKAS